MCNCNKEFELMPEFETELWNKSRHGSGSQPIRPSTGGGPGIKIYTNSKLGYVVSVPRAATSGELEDFEHEVVGTKDELKPVLDTTQVPFRWICHLELNFGPDPAHPGNDLLARGTGTLISPRHVLTCGHNLFDEDIVPGSPALEVKKIKVTPGYNCAGKIAAPFGSVYAAKHNFHSRWRSSLDYQFDYGLITLRSNIGDEPQKILGGKPLGYWGDKVNGYSTRLIPQTTTTLTGRRVSLSGYPGRKCCYKHMTPTDFCGNSNKWAGAQFWSYGKVTNASPPTAPNLLLYDTDTFKGHSGSPVWTMWDKYRNLAAIHTGPFSSVANRGVRITEELMKNIRSWM